MVGKSSEFIFHRHDNIGVAAAEQDATFLRNCFIDTGDLNILKDMSSPKRVILGRTGSGKSALLLKMVEDYQAINIDPESLSLNYISNSTIIKIFSDLGINLEPFYKLLWRHLFAVEVFKRQHNILNENSKIGFIARLTEGSGTRRQREESKRRRQKALDYIQRYGETFWEDTEYRAKEIVNKFEDQVKTELKGRGGLKLPSIFGLNIGANVEGGIEDVQKLTSEQKQLLQKRGQEVVNAIQVRQLSEILSLAGEVLEEASKDMIFVVDRLDENWVDDSIKMKLIRALINTASDFKDCPRLKILLSLRTCVRSHFTPARAGEPSG